MPGRGIQFLKITQWVSFCFVFGEGEKVVNRKPGMGRMRISNCTIRSLTEQISVCSFPWRLCQTLDRSGRGVQLWTSQLRQNRGRVAHGKSWGWEEASGEGCCFRRMKVSNGMCDNWVSRGGKDRTELKMSNSPHLLTLIRQDELWTEGFSVTPYFCPILQLGEEILYLDV